MSKELVSGEYCLAGHHKVKRIWLGCFNGRNLCVLGEHESDFKNGKDFQTDTWDICIPIPEIIYEYQWISNGRVWTVTFYTEKEVEEASYSRWTKLESSKRLR